MLGPAHRLLLPGIAGFSAYLFLRGGLSSPLLFDAAVYLMALGLVVTVVDRLGAGPGEHR
ncbi:hypothetical protein [Streptomyces radiopugnans]|uniref:hypothetical protein n=1 Tax=Streptomyces radiopugnans TaxID=403935 RepID=UPI003F1DA35A